MGRSAVIIPDQRTKTIDLTTLDDEIASILMAIETESVPEHLTELAVKFQDALVERKRSRNPN